jgi:non-homologous end joining protein Ku
MIAAKPQGQEVAEAPQPHLAPVIDLMEALKKSIAEKQAPSASSAQAGPVAVPAGKKPPARAVQPEPAAQKRGKKVG